MKRIILLLCVCLSGILNEARAQNKTLLDQVIGKYWAYDNSVWDSDNNPVHTFVERVNEGQVIAKGSGMFFEAGGVFHEVADEKKIGGKPCTGSWERSDDNTLKVKCGGETWTYKILQVKDGTVVLTVTGTKQRPGKTKKAK